MFLAACSIALIYTMILNVFYENRISLSIKDIPIYLAMIIILALSFEYKEIPSYIYYIIEPIAFIIIIRLTKKKTTFQAVIGYFTLLFSIIIVDLIVAIIAAPLGLLNTLAEISYQASAVLYWFAVIGVFFFRKSFHHRYIALSTQSRIRQEKFTITIYFAHLTILMLLYHANYQVVLNGAYKGLNSILYWIIIFVYVAFIYVQIILYNIALKRENQNRFRSQAKSLKSDLLSKSYALTHDLKNIMLLNNDLPIQSIMEEKTKLTEKLMIDLKASYTPLDYFNSLELSIVLSILLDNAIEHLEAWPILDQWISLKMDRNKLIVSNPIKTETIDRLKEQGYTTKSKASAGYGLANAIDLIEKNGYQIHYTLENQILTCLVDLDS